MCHIQGFNQVQLQPWTILDYSDHSIHHQYPYLSPTLDCSDYSVTQTSMYTFYRLLLLNLIILLLLSFTYLHLYPVHMPLGPSGSTAPHSFTSSSCISPQLRLVLFLSTLLLAVGHYLVLYHINHSVAIVL